MRDQTKIKLTMTGILPDPRKVHLSKEKYEESIHKVIENIFIYQKEITTEYILKMKNDLLHEIYDFEVSSSEDFKA